MFLDDPRFLGGPHYLAFASNILTRDRAAGILRRKFLRLHGKKIRKTVSDIKRGAEAISEAKVRTEIIGATERLGTQVKQLDEKLGQEISAVRRLIGSSESLQDWKLLVSDVHRLKGEHVPREIFDTEVRRIDEKIDNWLKALNTRLEDLKAIKFWSKRTLLEIALAIMTVIAALYGAGVI